MKIFVFARDQKKTNLTLALKLTLQRLLMLTCPSDLSSASEPSEVKTSES
ncbi:hypothetical protein A2U01_0115362, partial [Trifolium medium]|nr:hypothetical protein [Trifolium medium]